MFRDDVLMLIEEGGRRVGGLMGRIVANDMWITKGSNSNSSVNPEESDLERTFIMK